MLIIRILSRLPFAFHWKLSDFLFFLIYRVFGYRKSIVLENLRNCFPNKDESEIRDISIKFYKSFSDYIVETLKCLTISEKEIQKRVVFDKEELNDLLKNENIIVLCSHMFNWEYYGIAFHKACDGKYETLYSYQKLKNNFFDDLMKKIRGRFGSIGVERHLFANYARETEKERMLIVLGDQTPVGRGRRYWTKFLGRETAFYYGLGQLANISGKPMFSIIPQKTGRGRYKIKIEKVKKGSNPAETLENYIEKLESAIIDNPYNWLWSHRRWKTGKGKRDIIGDKLKNNDK